MMIHWDGLTSDDKQALERLFSHISFPVLQTTADRLIEFGLAEKKLGGVGITPAGEDLLMQHLGRG